MPRSVVLPEGARHMSANAAPQMRNELDQFPSPFESFSVLYYGEIEGDDIRGLLKEVDRDTWIEEAVGGGRVHVCRSCRIPASRSCSTTRRGIER